MSGAQSPKARWEVYLAYLQMKVEERDWHGVADAATDLRELEAKHPHLKPNPLARQTGDQP